jgi:hypothetical protein
MAKGRLIARRARKPKRGRKPVVRHAYMRSFNACANRIFNRLAGPAPQGESGPGHSPSWGVSGAVAQNPQLARSIARRIAAVAKSVPETLPMGTVQPVEGEYGNPASYYRFAAILSHFGLPWANVNVSTHNAYYLQAAASSYPPNPHAVAEMKQFVESVRQHSAGSPPGGVWYALVGMGHMGPGGWSQAPPNPNIASAMLEWMAFRSSALDRCWKGPEMRAPRFGQDEPMVQTMRIPVMAIGLGGTLGWLLARKR